MKFLCLATDYDGTLAQHGDVEASTVAALRQLRETGRKLVLVTGREMPDLLKVCHFTETFDRIVAENGALLHNPVDQSSKILAPEPPEEFVDALRARGVSRLSIGLGIVATSELYSGVVQETIQELGLPLQAIPNKGALMILPTNVDKATGLRIALSELHLQPSEVVGVGDAENDSVFLAMCGYSVAVANAIPALKKQADLVTRGRNGAGVEELIERFLANEFAEMQPLLPNF
jgi:hydroxymethylpyrimidine pyrophosphatase-like HAD family hydrolase